MMFEAREAEASDEKWVRASWLASASSGFAYRGMPRSRFEEQFSECMDRALACSAIIVIANKSEPQHAIGWCVSEYPDEDTAIVHYAYAKQAWRSKGVGAALFTAMGLQGTARVFYSHANTTSVRIGPKKGWQYDPFTFWRPKT